MRRRDLRACLSARRPRVRAATTPEREPPVEPQGAERIRVSCGLFGGIRAGTRLGVSDICSAGEQARRRRRTVHRRRNFDLAVGCWRVDVRCRCGVAGEFFTLSSALIGCCRNGYLLARAEGLVIQGAFRMGVPLGKCECVATSGPAAAAGSWSYVGEMVGDFFQVRVAPSSRLEGTTSFSQKSNGPVTQYRVAGARRASAERR